MKVQKINVEISFGPRKMRSNSMHQPCGEDLEGNISFTERREGQELPYSNIPIHSVKAEVGEDVGILRLRNSVTESLRECFGFCCKTKNDQADIFIDEIKKVSEKMSKGDTDEEVILVCGDTGAGKSTLINYLLDV